MSKISIKPNDSGTGTFTLESPNSNTDRTLTLPDEAGTVLTDTSDIESQVKTATNATGSAPIYSCRAWVNFNGTGTVAIRESGNVSSITDNGTGRYTVNFTTAMEDTNYSVAGVCSTNEVNRGRVVQTKTYTTSSFYLEVRATNAASDVTLDVDIINASIFR